MKTKGNRAEDADAGLTGVKGGCPDEK